MIEYINKFSLCYYILCYLLGTALRIMMQFKYLGHEMTDRLMDDQVIDWDGCPMRYAWLVGLHAARGQ